MVVLTFHLEEAVALLGWTIICLMIVVILSFLHTSLWEAVFWSYLPQYRWKFGQRMCSRATSLQAWGRKRRDGRGQRESLKQFYIFTGMLLPLPRQNRKPPPSCWISSPLSRIMRSKLGRLIFWLTRSSPEITSTSLTSDPKTDLQIWEQKFNPTL